MSMTISPDKGAHQNISRTTAVMDALSTSGAAGLRLTDVSQATGLGKATVHRVLAGLLAHGLAEQDEDTGRFFVGMRILAWAKSAGRRHGLQRICEASLIRLSQRTQDTIYLTVRSGSEAVCAGRYEGSYPIKTLTLEQGDRRPLGIGAGSLALLAFLPGEEFDKVYPQVVNEVPRFNVDEIRLHEMVSRSQSLGYALNDEDIISGMRAVALPIFMDDGLPVAAISVAAISSRMEQQRREQIVNYIREEIESIYATLTSRGYLTKAPKHPAVSSNVAAA